MNHHLWLLLHCKAEESSCNRDCVPTKPKIFATKKSLLTPELYSEVFIVLGETDPLWLFRFIIAEGPTRPHLTLRFSNSGAICYTGEGVFNSCRYPVKHIMD